MNYSAKKIPLTCDEATLQEWVAYMRGHLDEVSLSLAQEHVRHEMWFSGEDERGLYVIGVMDVDDQQHASTAATASELGVDRVHRQFKKHWDFSRAQILNIPSSVAPTFAECQLLFEAWP